MAEPQDTIRPLPQEMRRSLDERSGTLLREPVNGGSILGRDADAEVETQS